MTHWADIHGVLTFVLFFAGLVIIAFLSWDFWTESARFKRRMKELTDIITSLRRENDALRKRINGLDGQI